MMAWWISSDKVVNHLLNGGYDIVPVDDEDFDSDYEYILYPPDNMVQWDDILLIQLLGEISYIAYDITRKDKRHIKIVLYSRERLNIEEER